MYHNKHIVITGGSSGLGLELARRLVKEGAKITLIARNQEKLEQAENELKSINANAKVFIKSIDVSDESSTTTGIQQAAEHFDGIDILINSAGILREGTIDNSPIADYREVMEINYFGVINATRAALPFLKASKGKIVNIASVAGLTAAYGYSSYAASKHALIGFSETIRYELKSKGVTVQVVCPGEFYSPMVEDINKSRSAENKAHTQTLPPTTIDEIASGTLKGMRTNRFMILPGFMTKLILFAVRHFPGVVRVLGDHIIAKVQKKQK